MTRLHVKVALEKSSNGVYIQSQEFLLDEFLKKVFTDKSLGVIGSCGAGKLKSL